MTPHAQAIQKHYRRVWRAPKRELRCERGPAHELPEDFAVVQIRHSRDAWAFATRCMSQPGEAPGLELFLLAPDDTHRDSLAELLTAVAHFHRTGAPLGLGHTVNFGRPWLPGSRCTYGLMSLPYLDGPKLEWMEEPSIRFLWLIPITPEERALKVAQGLEALEQRFEQARFAFLDPLRDSVA